MAFAAHLEIDFAGCSTLADALREIVEHCAASRGSVHVLDSDGLLHLAASHGIPEAALEQIRTQPVNTSIAGLAVSRRQPVKAGNLQPDLAAGPSFGEKGPGLQTAIAFPIFRGDAVIGVLELGGPAERRFTEPEMDELLAAARELAERYISSAQYSAA